MMISPVSCWSRSHFPLLVAAAALSGCASSDRMMRLSPMSEVTPEASQHAGAAHASRLTTRTLTDDRVNAFPLYYAAAGMSSVMWPLVDWDDQGCAVRPFYNREGDNQSVVFPLSAWDESGGWAGNYLWDDKKGWMVAPLFGSWNKTDFVFPVFVTERPGEASAVRVFPLWFSDAHTSRVELLYSQTNHADGARSRAALFGLLYNDEVSADGTRRDRWVFPLGYQACRGDDHRWVTLPFSSGHDGERHWLNIHPLWWSAESPAGERTTLVPFYHQQRTGDRLATYTPLGMYETQGADREWLTWLFSSGREGEATWLNLHPLWWSSQSPEASSSLLLPLYYTETTPDRRATYTLLGMHETSAGQSRWATWLFSSGRMGNESWLNLHPLWWSSESPESTTRALLPLYVSTRTGEDQALYTLLGWNERQGENHRWVTLPFSEGQAGARRWLNIHPLWWSAESPESAWQLLAPLYLSTRGGERRGTYTLLGMHETDGRDTVWGTLPFSSGQVGDRRWFNVHPFWWSRESPSGSMQALLPLWWSSREGDSGAVYTPLGWRESTGEDYRWLTLPFSSGVAGDRRWLNVHPLWWSSESPQGFSDTLLPLWSRHHRADGSGSRLWPLGYTEYAPGGEVRLRNFLAFAYQWEQESESVSARHVCWPLYGSRDATVGVDKDFIGTFTLVAHESAPNLAAFRASPLYSDATGPGVSSLRDWLHLVSRRELAGESSLTVTPLAEFVSNQAAGRWRVTPLASSAEYQSDTCWRDFTHLVSVRSDEAGSSWTVTPLFERRQEHEGSRVRLTPLYTSGRAELADFSPWSPHLFAFNEQPGRSAWSFTPLFGGLRTAESESDRAWPFYWYEARAGKTISRGVFPFYASGNDETFLGSFCAWQQRTTEHRDTASLLGIVWNHERHHGEPRPAEPLFRPGAATRIERTGTLFTVSETAAAFRWTDEGPSAEDCRVLRRWCDESCWHRVVEAKLSDPEDGMVRGYSGYLDEARVSELRGRHEAVVALLTRHGYAPVTPTVAGVQDAIVRLARDHTRHVPRTRFAVDPLWIDWYHETAEGEASSWRLLFGLAHGEYSAGSGRTSVLGYFYTKETSPEGSRMNCFPFIQRDETPARKKVSFLWRLWNRETDVTTGKTTGHVLFIPY